MTGWVPSSRIKLLSVGFAAVGGGFFVGLAVGLPEGEFPEMRQALGPSRRRTYDMGDEEDDGPRRF